MGWGWLPETLRLREEDEAVPRAVGIQVHVDAAHLGRVLAHGFALEGEDVALLVEAIDRPDVDRDDGVVVNPEEVGAVGLRNFLSAGVAQDFGLVLEAVEDLGQRRNVDRDRVSVGAFGDGLDLLLDHDVKAEGVEGGVGGGHGGLPHVNP